MWNRGTQFIVATTGRQVGKSSEMAAWIDEGMNAEPDQLDRSGDPTPFVGVLGSTYDKAEISVNQYIERLAKTFGTDCYRLNQNKHELVIRDPLAGKPGARLKWLSGEEAYNVVGYTFSRFGIDEAQAIPDEVWFKFLPTTGVRNARGLITGTPDVTEFQTWFQGLWLKGQDPLDTRHHSFSVASWEAPWMGIDLILTAKDTLPEAEFRRLYGGEWVEEDGLVFTNIEQSLLSVVPEYDPKRRYVMSYDPAASEDFNVVMVGDPSTRIGLYMDRWNLAPSLLETYDRVESTWDRFGRPKVYIDGTALGGKAVAHELRQRGMSVISTAFNNENKMEFVRSLAADLQHRRIMIPAKWEDVRREFRQFIYKRTPTGKVTANAVAGAHDDTITALMLLNQAFHRSGESAESFSKNYLTGGSGLEKYGYR